MNTLGKITDSAVIIGSLAVGYGGVTALMSGIKTKSTGTIVLGGITVLISIYAMREAINKIND